MNITPEQQAQLDALTYEDIYRAMRSAGWSNGTGNQESMRRALVSFIMKRDIHGLPPYTSADGHRIFESAYLADMDMPQVEARVLAQESAYSVTHKAYGKSQPHVVRPTRTADHMKTRAARIAEGVGGRWVHRDHGYRMSDRQLERFKEYMQRPFLDYSPISRRWHDTDTDMYFPEGPPKIVAGA